MSKKNWISIKRGLSEDPKHRERMGMAVWLFLHIVDAADWETGMVYDWRDKEIGIDMTASTATIREWRQKLTDLGYITCVQKQHSLEIIIHNWNNPKEYSSPKINIFQGKSKVAPSEKEEIEKAAQGTPQGDNQALDESRANHASFIESTSTSTSEPVKPVSSSKEERKTSKSLTPHVPEGFPTPTGDILADWNEIGRRHDEKVKPFVVVLEALAQGFPYNFPKYGENLALDRVVKLIAQDGRDIQVFIKWAKANKRDPHWYHVKPDSLWGDWPQAFIAKAKGKEFAL